MVKSYEDLREKTLGMTGFFETSSGYPTCYGVTSGNHDGAGLSHGVLQFNWGTGSLKTLWQYMDTNHNQLCRDIFGANYAEWEDVLNNKTVVEQIAWGDSISVPVGNEEKRGVDPTWKALFQTLGETHESITKQMTFSEEWVTNAVKWFKALGLYSRRGFALLWDISVQMGRLFSMNQILHDFRQIDPTGKTKAQIEEEKLLIIVDRCSYDNRPSEFSDIVHKRKLMLVTGTGDYYGTPFTMAQYDLNYEPAFKGAVYLG